MTSVPNRQLPLSGSNLRFWTQHSALRRSALLTLLGFSTAFSLMSCSFFKPATSTSTGSAPKDVPTEYGATPNQHKPAPSGNVSVYDPIKGWITIQTKPQERIDTIRWKEGTGPAGPITSDAVRLPNTNTGIGAVPVIPGVPATNSNPDSPVNRPGQYNNQVPYNVAVLLPFMSGTGSSTIAANSVGEWALQYYGGLKMALSTLDQEGIRLNVSVLDTKADTLEMYRLLRQPEVQNAQLLIGPYRRDDIRILAEYAKRNNKPMVSPYSAVGSLTQNNPNYIQMNPSLESHCRALLNHALSEFRPEEIVIVTRNVVGEQNCLEYLRKAYEPKRAMGNAPIQEYFLPGEGYNNLNLRPYIQNKAQAAIIVPSWADETYIFYLLRAVKSAKAVGQKVVVYGMPQWIDFEHMEFDLYEQCQVRVSQVAYVDDQSPEVVNFKKEFFNQYSALPNPEAFTGYDHMVYFGRLLANFGPKVSDNLERNDGTGLQTGFNFSRIVNSAPFGAEQYAPTQRYENRFVHILEFAGYQFKPLPVVPR